MARVLYGYRLSMGKASIYAPEACVVIAILTFPPGERAKAAREAARLVGLDIPALTIKDLVRRTIKRRKLYETGQLAIDQAPRPELKLI